MTSGQAFDIVRYKAIVEEIFQAWISKIKFHHDRGRDHFHPHDSQVCTGVIAHSLLDDQPMLESTLRR